MDNRDMAHLNDVRDQLGKQIEAGFLRVNTRLDILNGRVGKGEIESAIHQAKLENLEREIFPRGGRRKVDPIARPKGNISERDVRVVLATIGIQTSALLFVFKVLPYIMKAIAP